MKAVLKHDARLTPSGAAECVIRSGHDYDLIFLDISRDTPTAYAAAQRGAVHPFGVPGGKGYTATHGPTQNYEEAVVERNGYVLDLATNLGPSAFVPGAKLATLAQLRSIALLAASRL